MTVLVRIFPVLTVLFKLTAVLIVSVRLIPVLTVLFRITPV